jgi:hypothetical protein
MRTAPIKEIRIRIDRERLLSQPIIRLVHTHYPNPPGGFQPNIKKILSRQLLQVINPNPDFGNLLLSETR